MHKIFTSIILLAALFAVTQQVALASSAPVLPLRTNHQSEKSTFDVSGRVSDKANGQGLPGVNILIKGTNSGTITNADGDYKLTIPDNAEVTLVFSFIGYVTKEIPAGKQQTLDVILDADNSNLNEVVVVGYGTQNKRDITGSVGSLSAKSIKDFPCHQFLKTPFRGRLPVCRYRNLAGNQAQERRFGSVGLALFPAVPSLCM